MTSKLHCIFLLMATLGLVSCTSHKGFPDRVIDEDTELKNYEQYFISCKTDEGSCTPINKKTSKIDEYNNTNPDDELKRQRIRNEIINGRIAATDIQFSLFQQKLHEEGVDLNIGTDAVILGLGAAGALVSGGTSQILSATSAALLGMRESVDKNMFFKQTMPALFAQMIAKRKTVLVNIRLGLQKETSQYPLQQGFADLEEYRYAGTIPGAISTVVENAGAESTIANEELSDILRLTGRFVITNTTKTLNEWLKPNGIRNRDRFNKLNSWLKTQQLPDSVSFFISAKHREEERKRAIEHLRSIDENL